MSRVRGTKRLFVERSSTVVQAIGDVWFHERSRPKRRWRFPETGRVRVMEKITMGGGGGEKQQNEYLPDSKTHRCPAASASPLLQAVQARQAHSRRWNESCCALFHLQILGAEAFPWADGRPWPTETSDASASELNLRARGKESKKRGQIFK